MKLINLYLKIWRQENIESKGYFESHKIENINSHMSFLEMLDVLNEDLIKNKKDPIAFEHDCREGICGTCSMTINGKPHGPLKGTTACQLHMFNFEDGDTRNVLQCGQLNDPILEEKGSFTPDYYIIMNYTGDHYKLITYKDKGIFKFQELPFGIRD